MADFTRAAREYLPFLPNLLALWIPGDLQAWRGKGINHGGLAGIAL